MVTMRMSNVNGNEILATLGEPIDEILRMLDGQKRINEDGIVFAVNQRNCVGNPGQIFRAWRKPLSYAMTLLCQDLPIQFRHKIFPPLWFRSRPQEERLTLLKALNDDVVKASLMGIPFVPLPDRHHQE